jgi:hypothetical protein
VVLLKILEIIVIVLILRSVITFISGLLVQRSARSAESKSKRFTAEGSTIVDGEFKNLK